MAEKPDETVSGDSSMFCGLCGHETSIAMIWHHLEREHDLVYDAEEIAGAPIVVEPGSEDDPEERSGV